VQERTPAPVDDGEASGRREYPDHGPRERTCRGLLAVHDDWQRANGEPVLVNTITAIRGRGCLKAWCSFALCAHPWQTGARVVA
jgi:hypothetical protein